MLIWAISITGKQKLSPRKCRYHMRHMLKDYVYVRAQHICENQMIVTLLTEIS